MDTEARKIRKGDTVTVNSSGKLGTVTGVSRNGALLVKYADGGQYRGFPRFVTLVQS